MKLFHNIIIITLLTLGSCDNTPKKDSDKTIRNDFCMLMTKSMKWNHVTHKIMAEHYDQKEAEFSELQDFIQSNLPDSSGVHIEFTNEEELNIFHVKNREVSENNWNIRRESDKYDSLLMVIGWTDSLVSICYQKLQNIDCISISSYSNQKTDFGYKRDGMGIYYYLVHASNLSEKSEDKYWPCSAIYYRDNVVFEYGSGAFGSTCFPNKFTNNTSLTY